jgi:hypothetical protein
MIRPHGIDRSAWENAKREARAARIVAARSDKGTITYNELARQIISLRLEADSLALRELLGEISLAEEMAGRGMLSVVVVHQGGDGLPGHGFFTLAKGLGRDTTDQARLAVECGKVHAIWKNGQSQTQGKS